MCKNPCSFIAIYKNKIVNIADDLKLQVVVRMLSLLFFPPSMMLVHTHLYEVIANKKKQLDL